MELCCSPGACSLAPHITRGRMAWLDHAGVQQVVAGGDLIAATEIDLPIFSTETA